MQMTRFKAFSIHLLLSVSVVAIVAALTLYIWYPGFYFAANGAWYPLRTVLMVDAILGPLMMLILFKPGKKGLKLDLAFIFIIQVSALTYGVSTLYLQRPVLLVQHNSIIVCLNAQQAEQAGVDLAPLEKNAKPFPFVYLPMPDTQQESQWQERIDNLPKDRISMPAYVFGELFQPVNYNNINELLQEELDLTRAIRTNERSQQAWASFKQKHGTKVNDYAYYTMACSPDEYVAAVERQQGNIVDVFQMNTLNAVKKRFVKQQQGLPKIDWLGLDS